MKNESIEHFIYRKEKCGLGICFTNCLIWLSRGLILVARGISVLCTTACWAEICLVSCAGGGWCGGPNVGNVLTETIFHVVFKIYNWYSLMFCSPLLRHYRYFFLLFLSYSQRRMPDHIECFFFLLIFFLKNTYQFDLCFIL